MDSALVLRELWKLGAITGDQARRSLDRLETLEKNRPAGAQVARYAAVGALAAPAIRSVGNLIRGKAPLEGAGAVGKLRELAADAAKGGLTSGAIPLVRDHLDRRAETKALHQYLRENVPRVSEKRAMPARMMEAFVEAIQHRAKSAGSLPPNAPPPRRNAPLADATVAKESALLPEGVTSKPSDFRPVDLLKKRASLNPFQAAAAAKRVATSAARNPSAGISIRDLAKPQGKGFGSGLSGAFAGRIGGTAPLDLETTAVGAPSA